jgi:hypothetical protein
VSSSATLSRRLSMLEKQQGSLAPVCLIMTYGNQTEEDARAVHEIKHGPVLDNSEVMFIRFVAP